MPGTETAVQAGIENSRRAGPFRALLAKEWHEQRWRFALGTVVMAAMLAGLLRAQVIPFNEASLLIYWPVGIVLVIFLAMGPVAAERADRTWEFLLAQPVSRSRVLVAKWLVGLIQLVGILLVSTVAGVLAMASRGMASFTSLTADIVRETRNADIASVTFAEWVQSHPIYWVCLLALGATVALASWYTPLFFILTRARNEFAAALGGILLTIAVHAWLAELALSQIDSWFAQVALVVVWLNPLWPMVMVIWSGYVVWLPLVMFMHVLLWIVLPVWLAVRLAGKAGRI
jgi:hypothetical protein